MKVVVKASKAAKQRNKIVASTNWTDEQINGLIDDLEETGNQTAYDATGNPNNKVVFIEESEDNYGEPVLIFEVHDKRGRTINVIQIGLGTADGEDIDPDEIYAYFEMEVRTSFN